MFKKSIKNIIRLFKFLKQYIFLIVLSVIAITVFNFLNLGLINTLKNIIDSSLKSLNKELAHYIFLAFLFVLGQIISRMIHNYTADRFNHYSMYKMRKYTIEKFMSIKLTDLQSKPIGDWLSRINNDFEIIRYFLSEQVTMIIWMFLQFVIMFSYMMIINWKLTLFCLMPVPILLFASAKISGSITVKTKEMEESLAQVNSDVQDNIAGINVIKSFTLEDDRNKSFKKDVLKSLKKSLNLSYQNALLSPVDILFSALPYAILFSYGGFLIIKGNFTLGMLVAYIDLLGSVLHPFRFFSQILSSTQSSSGALDRIYEIWDMENEERTKQADNINKNAERILTFNDIYFGYKDKDIILKGINFTIRRGEKAAIVGESGSGKSTILKLICRFITPDSGVISLYDKNIEDLSLRTLRNDLSIVTQDTYLFPCSIMKNIKYGSVNASDEEAVEAAKAANIDDFIMSLPDGYDSLVGERGIKLSGGQKQRIAIARAVLKNSPILLLDEATSALDVESEHDVQMALDKLMEGRTVIIIAHRLSTIKNADRILVLHNGKIAEEGTHDNLITHGKLYKQLYFNQFKNDNIAVSGVK